jgi:hypothetical protein
VVRRAANLMRAAEVTRRGGETGARGGRKQNKRVLSVFFWGQISRDVNFFVSGRKQGEREGRRGAVAVPQRIREIIHGRAPPSPPRL